MAKSITLTTECGNIVLQDLLEVNLSLRKRLLNITKKIRALSKSDKYSKVFGLLTSVPGIGPITAITIIAELETVDRFCSSVVLTGFVHTLGWSQIQTPVGIKKKLAVSPIGQTGH